MAKQLAVQSGVILLVIAVATFISNFGMRELVKGKDYGQLEQKVEGNTTNIIRIDNEGTKELQRCMQKIAVLEAILTTVNDNIKDNREFMKENRSDMKEIKSLLMRPVTN